MPKADEQENAARAIIWSTEDFAFARRELREEFPLHSAQATSAALQAAEHLLQPTSGRVRLVQLARELIRRE